MVNVEASNKPRIWNTRWTERQRDRDRETRARTQTQRHIHSSCWLLRCHEHHRHRHRYNKLQMLFSGKCYPRDCRERERVAVVVEAWVAGRRACVQSSFVGPPATFPYAHYSSSSAGFAGYVLDLSLLVIGRYSLSLCMRVFPSHYFCPEFLLSLLSIFPTAVFLWRHQSFTYFLTPWENSIICRKQKSKLVCIEHGNQQAGGGGGGAENVKVVEEGGLIVRDASSILFHRFSVEKQKKKALYERRQAKQEQEARRRLRRT